ATAKAICKSGFSFQSEIANTLFDYNGLAYLREFFSTQKGVNKSQSGYGSSRGVNFEVYLCVRQERPLAKEVHSRLHVRRRWQEYPPTDCGPPFEMMNPSADAKLSPRHKWLAYISDDRGRPEVYLTSFGGAGSKAPSFDSLLFGFCPGFG